MFDEVAYDAIDAHLRRHIGKSETVWHEIVSPDIHVDVILFPPARKRPFWVLSTVGMSYREMTVPEDLADREFWLRAEMMVALPEDWFSEGDLDLSSVGEAKYYPIRRLKELARYPHNAATSLMASHTLRFGETLGPGTDMNSVVIWWPTYMDEGDDIVELPDGRTVNLYSIIPIYEAERQYAIANGTDALLDRLGEAGVTSLFDPDREAVVK